jgi:hypothetical protein
VKQDFNLVVKNNQSRLEYLRSRTVKSSFDKKLLGTVDIAVNRINNVLLILSQQPLDAMNLAQDLYVCQTALSQFVNEIKKMDCAVIPFKWYYKLKIHFIGKYKITKIKKLLERVESIRV